MRSCVHKCYYCKNTISNYDHYAISYQRFTSYSTIEYGDSTPLGKEEYYCKKCLGVDTLRKIRLKLPLPKGMKILYPFPMINDCIFNIDGTLLKEKCNGTNR